MSSPGQNLLGRVGLAASCLRASCHASTMFAGDVMICLSTSCVRILKYTQKYHSTVYVIHRVYVTSHYASEFTSGTPVPWLVGG